jgi:Na+/H+ antiporter NhaD/arsenite permease-like protein
MLSRAFAASRVFDRLVVVATRVSRADPARITVVFGVVMYVVSGLVNKQTALILVLPVLRVLLKLTGARQRYVS